VRQSVAQPLTRIAVYNIRLEEAQYRIEHRHGDGSVAPMTEVPVHHDSTQHDPERSWGVKRLFRCTRCDETVLIAPEEDAAERRA
jgi:hypothetical protein